MRAASFRRAVIVAVLGGAVAAVLSSGKPALAALQEKEVLDDINDTVAVLRHLHWRIADAEENLRLVRAARDLTQQQLDSQRRLYESEKAKGNEKEAAVLKADLDRLQRQIDKLNEFDFEALYGARIEEAKKQIQEITVILNARIAEYKAIFGKTPRVELAFEEEIRRRRGVRPEAGYYLRLD